MTISSIVQQLSDIGISLIDDYTNSKNHHLMRCNYCAHEFTATPNSKIQNFKKHGAGGCPACTAKRVNGHKQEARSNVLQLIKDRGYEVLTLDYNGNQQSNYQLLVKRISCGHEFYTTPTNLIHRGVICPVCNSHSSLENIDA